MRKKLNTQFNTRQYMVSRDFEIYYYKDQHMKKVANHIHDYYEIYFFLEGDVSLEIEKKEYPLQYGDVAVVPPGLESIMQSFTMKACPIKGLYSGLRLTI